MLPRLVLVAAAIGLLTGCVASRPSTQADLVSLITSGDAAAVAAALRAGANPNQHDMRFNPLRMAADRGDIAIVEMLVEAGARVNERPGAFLLGHRPSALCTAIVGHHRDVVVYLLAHGADPEICDDNGRTALHFAAMVGTPGMIGDVLARGADLQARDPYGETAISFAARVGTDDAVRNVAELIARGLSVNTRDRWKRTPLHWAAEAGKVAAVEMLLAAGAEPDPAAADGETPLWPAAAAGRADIVAVLLRAGANPNAMRQKLGSAVDVARRNGHEDVVALLVR
jgi:uncharacterized protein